MELEKKRKMEALERDDRIVLNVGGQRFETTRTTLMTFQGSMLTERFSKRNSSVNYPDKDGEYFFDRNPDSFKAILECYRNHRRPFSEMRPGTVRPHDWDHDLLFWGLASVERTNPPFSSSPRIPDALLEIEEQRRVNRERFCELVYEEMKDLMKVTDEDYLPVTLWICANQNLLCRKEERHPFLSSIPIPPKNIDDSDVSLYMNRKYWTAAFVWFQVKSIETKSDQVQLHSQEEICICNDDHSAKNFRDIWKHMGIKMNIVEVSRPKYYRKSIEYPEQLWDSRELRPKDKPEYYSEWHEIKLNVHFTAPGAETSVFVGNPALSTIV